MLSGLEIKRRAESGEGIYIEDFDVSRLNPNSYNLRLHSNLQIYSDAVLDSKKKNDIINITIPEEGFILQPGELYLGRTVEATSTTGLVPCLNGRSSIGRLGIAIHITAGFGDNGFSSEFWTLEITAIKPVRIYPNMEICQIWYDELIGDPSMVYEGKYQHKTIMASEMYKDF